MESAANRLESGDRLTRDAFERRHEATPPAGRAELVQGVVDVTSPTRHRIHGRPYMDLLTWLGTYRALTPGVDGGAGSAIRLGEFGEPQPDALLRIETPCGGASAVDEEGYVTGAPELVAEVATSSASGEVHQKLDMVRTHGVREYLVWRVADGAIDWFALRGQRYAPLPADADGATRSKAFPGLALDRPAMAAGDLEQVLRVLREGIASPIHAAFVRSLERARAPRAGRTARTRRTRRASRPPSGSRG